MVVFVPMDSECAAYVMPTVPKIPKIFFSLFFFSVRVSCQSNSAENCTVFTSNALEVEQSLGNLVILQTFL